MAAALPWVATSYKPFYPPPQLVCCVSLYNCLLLSLFLVPSTHMQVWDVALCAGDGDSGGRLGG